MSVFSWFFDGTYSAKQLRQLIGALMAKLPDGSRPLGARSGITTPNLSSILTVTSTTWTLTPFTGVYDEHTDKTLGPVPFVSDANLTGGVTAADASHDRIDLLSLTMAVASSTQPHIVYTVGTPAASPSVPATPANSFPLAQIRVPKATTGSPSATWVAPTFTAVPPKCAGQASVGGTAGSVQTVDVVFPVGLFKQTPIVVVSGHGTNPQNFSASTWNETADGFTIEVYSVTTATRTINWIAIATDA